MSGILNPTQSKPQHVSQKRKRTFICDPVAEMQQNRSAPPRPGSLYLSDQHLVSCTCLSFVTVVAFQFTDSDIDVEELSNISSSDILHMLLAAVGVLCFFLALYGWSLYFYALCCISSRPTKKKTSTKKADTSKTSTTSNRTSLPSNSFIRNKRTQPTINMTDSGSVKKMTQHRAAALGENVIQTEQQLMQFLQRTGPTDKNVADGVRFASITDRSSLFKSFDQSHNKTGYNRNLMNQSFAPNRSAGNAPALGVPYGSSNRFGGSMNLSATGFNQTGFNQTGFNQTGYRPPQTGFNQTGYQSGFQNQSTIGTVKSNQPVIARAYVEEENASDKKASSDLYVISTELLKSLKIKGYMQSWVENVRSWISMELVRKKAEAWRKSDKFVLETVRTLKISAANDANQLAQLERFVTLQQKFELLWSNRGWSQFTPDMQQKLLRRHNLREELKRICPGAPDYVHQRVEDLSKSSFLSDYKWNAGGQWDGKKWSKLLPTDARLIMMIFFHYMDDYLSPMNFSKEYVATEKKVSLSQSVSDFGLKQTRFKIKKHFCIVDAEKEEPFYFILNNIDSIDEAKWVPQPGSQNVFHTIALFGYLVKKHCRGQINSVSLDTHSCRFLKNFPMKEDRSKEIFF